MRKMDDKINSSKKEMSQLGVYVPFSIKGIIATGPQALPLVEVEIT